MAPTEAQAVDDAREVVVRLIGPEEETQGDEDDNGACDHGGGAQEGARQRDSLPELAQEEGRVEDHVGLADEGGSEAHGAQREVLPAPQEHERKGQ